MILDDIKQAEVDCLLLGMQMPELEAHISFGNEPEQATPVSYWFHPEDKNIWIVRTDGFAEPTNKRLIILAGTVGEADRYMEDVGRGGINHTRHVVVNPSRGSVRGISGHLFMELPGVQNNVSAQSVAHQLRQDKRFIEVVNWTEKNLQMYLQRLKWQQELRNEGRGFAV